MCDIDAVGRDSICRTDLTVTHMCVELEKKKAEFTAAPSRRLNEVAILGKIEPFGS